MEQLKDHNCCILLTSAGPSLLFQNNLPLISYFPEIDTSTILDPTQISTAYE